MSTRTTTSRSASAAFGVLKGLKGSKVVDEYTFQIELAGPNTGFIEAIASLPNYYIESPAAFEKYGKDTGQHAVGTGPFKLVEWVRGQRTVMARNDDYWGKKPTVDQMVYRPDPRAGGARGGVEGGRGADRLGSAGRSGRTPSRPTRDSTSIFAAFRQPR